jgi:hypothetical protein
LHNRVDSGGEYLTGFSAAYWRANASAHADTSTLFSPQTAEQVEKCLTKSQWHEAVRDGITAWRCVRQQLKETYGLVAQILVKALRIKKSDRIYNVKWRPAYKKFNDNDKEHFDDTTLIQETLGRIWSKLEESRGKKNHK